MSSATVGGAGEAVETRSARWDHTAPFEAADLGPGGALLKELVGGDEATLSFSRRHPGLIQHETA